MRVHTRLRLLHGSPTDAPSRPPKLQQGRGLATGRLPPFPPRRPHTPPPHTASTPSSHDAALMCPSQAEHARPTKREAVQVWLWGCSCMLAVACDPAARRRARGGWQRGHKRGVVGQRCSGPPAAPPSAALARTAHGDGRIALTNGREGESACTSCKGEVNLSRSVMRASEKLTAWGARQCVPGTRRGGLRGPCQGPRRPGSLRTTRPSRCTPR